MWFQRIQRKWYFLHKSCANQPKLFRCGRWSSWGMRVFTWDLTSSPEVGRWQEGPRRGLFFLVFTFFLTFSLSRGVAKLCYKVTFIWCGIILFSWSWNDWNRIRVDTHISCSCVCGVRLPTWFLFLTSQSMLLINYGCYFQRVSPWQHGIKYERQHGIKYNIFDRRRRSVYSTNNSTLPLIIEWQSTPRSRIKLFKILNPTCSVYTIVLCPENASESNDTVTGLNWIPATDKMDTYRTPARFPVFEWVLYQEHTFTTKDKIHETSGKPSFYH